MRRFLGKIDEFRFEPGDEECSRVLTIPRARAEPVPGVAGRIVELASIGPPEVVFGPRERIRHAGRE
jgi:hypothetical protein